MSNGSDDSSEVAAVRYTFAVLPSSASEWRVRALYLTEALSEPYHAVLEVMTTEPDVELTSFVGKSAEIEMIRDDKVHRVCGVVLRMDYAGSDRDHVFARVEVVPAFFLLGQRATSRIFQGHTVPDILGTVLQEGLSPFERNTRQDLRGSYAEREYCLQHEETDRDFVERLMQEEGIWYSFDHAGDKETLVLHDQNPAFEPVTTDPLRVTGFMSQGFTPEALRSFAFSKELRPSAVEVRGFDWTHPDLAVKAKAAGTTNVGPKREVYWHGSEALLGRYTGDKYGGTTANARARVRAEGHEARVLVAQGHGHIVKFGAGATFEITEHAISSMDGKYLLTRVEHRADLPTDAGQSVAVHQLEPGYENTFTCIPYGTPFRPARTLFRPRIGGLQSAIVTGPAGEEIHTDVHGRIKVRFPWDRGAPDTDASSCWVRVAQTWGGAAWGTLFIPRVGMEVLVAFFDGDPDRPIVIGSTYNGSHPPPYELPAHKTKSGIKTSSSPGNGGNNEIRFEDAADHEELYFQAQKDLEILVKNNKNQRVVANETLHVEKNRDRTIDGDQTLTVHGNDTSGIDKNQSVTVNKDQQTVVLGHRSVTVALTQSTDVGLAASLNVGTEHTVNVGGRQDISVEGSRNLSVAKDQNTSIDGMTDVSIAKQAHVTVGAELKVDVTKDIIVAGHTKVLHSAEKDFAITGERITLTATKEMVLKVGDASITLKENGDITIKGNKINVKGDGDVKIKGSKVAGN